MKDYFVIGSEKWKNTVKFCVMLGSFIGLLVGAKMIING